ncbi:MAG: hypothetical protein EOP45_15770 [Sphingobacteriaceae bacterium]|nr:MAG: hypothetical protein EOP45_15770 [Sphingobacteriaceae bacterium]
MAKPVFYDEMFSAADVLRPHYEAYGQWLNTLPKDRLTRKKAEADLTFHRLGITFAVYGEEAGTTSASRMKAWACVATWITS